MAIELFLPFIFLFPAQAETWVDLSRQLTLDTEALPRSVVIEKLRKVKDLRTKVEDGLHLDGTRAYALDIIAALKDTSFIPELKEQIVNDPDGYATLTLNTLVDHSSYKSLAEKYKDLITNHIELLAPATTLVLVDSLARWGTEIDKETIEVLLAHEYPEIRIAVVDYLRLLILRFHKKPYLLFVPKLLKLKPFQVRLKALHLMDELPGGKVRRNLLEACLIDKNFVVRRKCFQLNEKWGVE